MAKGQAILRLPGGRGASSSSSSMSMTMSHSPLYPSSQVRTDSSVRTLTSFFKPVTAASIAAAAAEALKPPRADVVAVDLVDLAVDLVDLVEEEVVEDFSDKENLSVLSPDAGQPSTPAWGQPGTLQGAGKGAEAAYCIPVPLLEHASSHKLQHDCCAGHGAASPHELPASLPSLLHAPPAQARVVATGDSALPAHPRTRFSSPETPCKRAKEDCRLTSILELRQALNAARHRGLSEALGNHTFVGCIDNTLALFQHQTWLYSLEVVAASEAYFYQCFLLQFARFGVLQLATPLRIAEVVAYACPDSPTTTTTTTPEEIEVLLASKAPMFAEYFGIGIQGGQWLTTLPNLLHGYEPDLAGLPDFLHALGTRVSWVEEGACFEQVGRALASLYALCPPAEGEETEAPTDPALPIRSVRDRDPAYKWMVEHVLFPAFKRKFWAPAALVTEGAVVEMASLPELYKVFERC
jgi:hypothetical protein